MLATLCTSCQQESKHSEIKTKKTSSGNHCSFAYAVNSSLLIVFNIKVLFQTNMDNQSEDSSLVATPGRGRKRTRNEDNWAKNRKVRVGLV